MSQSLHHSLLCLIAFCAIVSLARADAPRVLPIGQMPQDKRLETMKDLDSYYPMTPCSTKEEWEQRASQLRRQAIVSAGLWPMPEKSTANPVIHGRVDREGYTVEKVILETYPGFYLTGNLYRPKNREGKLPAVLCPHGHWPDGRFNDAGVKEVRKQIVEGAERFEVGGRHPLQARCVQLARMGCVVFHYDMVGYADSRQLKHRTGMRPEMNDPERWGFFSPQAEARMQTIFGLQTYNSIRALDFVCDLPDVDPARIGVTGASGGGTQTFILCAIDPRPAVALPAVMVSTAMQGGCPCENGSYLRIGAGSVDLAGLMAPRPLGMTGANDWTKDIDTKGLPELKALYRLLGVEDLVMAKTLLQFGHNYNYVSREVMYHWFNKHLKLGLEEPVIEEDYQPLTQAEMTVWDTEHPVPPGGDEFEREFLQRLNADSQRQIESLRPKDEASLKEYRRVVGGALAVMIGRDLPKPDGLEAVNAQSESIGSWKLTKFLLRYPAQGEELPVIRLDPKNWNRRAVIWIDRNGKQSLFTDSGALRPEVETLLKNGCAVFGVDLLGQGEFTADGKPLEKLKMFRHKYAKPEETWGDYAGYTFGYNPPMFAERVRDVLSVVAFAKSDKVGADRVDLMGLGGAGHWAAAARAIAGEAVHHAVIDTAGFRFANLTAADDPDFLPGGAKYDDLPGMIALSAPLPIRLIGEEPAGLASVAAAYSAANHAKHLDIDDGKGAPSEAAAIEWLLKNSD